MWQKKYSQNFLSEVIFQIRFVPILELLTTEENAAFKFQKIVSEEFPNVRFHYNRKINFKINAVTGEMEKTNSSENYLIWEFYNDDSKLVKLSGENLILSYKDYHSFNDFCKDIELIWSALKEYMEPKINFMGLRYINRIPNLEDKDLKDFINPNLIHNNIFEEPIIQSLSRLEFRIDNYFLAFQYGQFNPQYPNEDTKKDFILDYDCVLRDLNINNINTNLNNMKKIINEKFEESIGEELREYMRG